MPDGYLNGMGRVLIKVRPYSFCYVFKVKTILYFDDNLLYKTRRSLSTFESLWCIIQS